MFFLGDIWLFKIDKLSDLININFDLCDKIYLTKVTEDEIVNISTKENKDELVVATISSIFFIKFN